MKHLSCNTHFEFEVVVDDLDYNGPLTKPQRFIVSTTSVDDAWELAEHEAQIRATECGRRLEFTLMLINEGSET